IRALGQGHTARRVDRGLASVYRREPRRLLLSLFFHFVPCALGTIEAYLILYFLRTDVALATRAVIQAVGAGVRFVTCMLPAGRGRARPARRSWRSCWTMGRGTGARASAGVRLVATPSVSSRPWPARSWWRGGSTWRWPPTGGRPPRSTGRTWPRSGRGRARA